MITIGTSRPQQILRLSAALLFLALNGLDAAGTRVQAIGKEKPLGTQGILQVPEGTILPVRLKKELSSRKNKPGDQITGRIMQTVPPPNGGRIKAGAKVRGEIVGVTSASTGGGGEVSLRFDTLEMGHQQIAIRTSLRALAAWIEVYNADLPATTRDYGTSINWTTTYQIGGDVVYGLGGPVTNAEGETVGTAVNNGVLARVRAKEGTKCRGVLGGNDSPQALWVFSADACGLYGYPNFQIEHAGRTEPIGQVRLAAVQGDLKIWGASGMLLRVVRASR